MPRKSTRYTRNEEKGIQTQHDRKWSTYKKTGQENKNYKNNQKESKMVVTTYQ